MITIQQTIDIPADRRVVLDLPEPVPTDAYICPHCGKTEHVPNAETIAAMQEVNDMIDGKIPARSFHSLDELLEELES